MKENKVAVQINRLSEFTRLYLFYWGGGGGGGVRHIGRIVHVHLWTLRAYTQWCNQRGSRGSREHPFETIYFNFHGEFSEKSGKKLINNQVKFTNHPPTCKFEPP